MKRPGDSKHTEQHTTKATWAGAFIAQGRKEEDIGGGHAAMRENKDATYKGKRSDGKDIAAKGHPKSGVERAAEGPKEGGCKESEGGNTSANAHPR